MARKSPLPTRSIPLLACKKILKEQGANRVEDAALVVFQKLLEQEVQDQTVQVLKYSRHAKRRTILADDVQLALANKR